MQQSIELSAALELFLLDAQSQHFTNHTLRFYRERLSLFVRWCADQDVTRLDALAAPHIRQFFVHLQQKSLSSAYVHSFARAIRTFCNYCVRDELIAVSPFAKVKMPKLESKVLPALSQDEIDAILAQCEILRDAAIVLFMLDSGVRATELIMLNVGGLSFKTGEVRVRMGKGQKDRLVFVGAKTRKAVKRYLVEGGDVAPNESLFVSEKGGGRLTYFGLAQVFKRLKKASGVDFSAHALRRTFAINCLRRGMDLYTLSRLMGHAGIIVLQKYLDLLPDDLRQAHDRHGPVDNMK